MIIEIKFDQTVEQAENESFLVMYFSVGPSCTENNEDDCHVLSPPLAHSEAGNTLTIGRKFHSSGVPGRKSQILFSASMLGESCIGKMY